MSPHIDIFETRAGDSIRLTLRGELDYATVPDLEDRLRALREEALPVRLNLSHVEFMDSSGLSALIHVVNQSLASSWRVEIEHDVSPFIESRFKNSGLAHMLGW
jgi:anti-anti-sigma factor